MSPVHEPTPTSSPENKTLDLQQEASEKPDLLAQDPSTGGYSIKNPDTPTLRVVNMAPAYDGEESVDAPVYVAKDPAIKAYLQESFSEETAQTQSSEIFNQGVFNYAESDFATQDDDFFDREATAFARQKYDGRNRQWDWRQFDETVYAKKMELRKINEWYKQYDGVIPASWVDSAMISEDFNKIIKEGSLISNDLINALIDCPMMGSWRGFDLALHFKLNQEQLSKVLAKNPSANYIERALTGAGVFEEIIARYKHLENQRRKEAYDAGFDSHFEAMRIREPRSAAEAWAKHKLAEDLEADEQQKQAEINLLRSKGKEFIMKNIIKTQLRLGAEEEVVKNAMLAAGLI